MSNKVIHKNISSHDNNKFILLLQKGVYPYEYIDNSEKFIKRSWSEKENYYSHVKVMKRAASCKHRQAVKTIQCEKKLFNSHFYILLKLRKCVEKHYTSTYRRWPPVWKAFFLSTCCKNEIEIDILTVTSSWGYQHCFSAETSQLDTNTTHFYDWVANNLINF